MASQPIDPQVYSQVYSGLRWGLRSRDHQGRWAAISGLGGNGMAIALFLFLVGLAPAAQAERPTGLRMCVSTPEPRRSDIYVALAYKTQNSVAGVAFEDWISKGWWKLDKNLSYSCITLTTEELQNRHYYFYAQGGGRVWDGNYFFCMDPLKPYGTDEADVNCEANGFARRGFRQIDTLGDRGFTIQLE